MSGDLISRETLLEDVRNNITECSGIMGWLKLINSQPVAYDVDKVVEQIDSISVERADYSESVECNISERGCISSCYECIKNHVEMIVKAGGVE